VKVKLTAMKTKKIMLCTALFIALLSIGLNAFSQPVPIDNPDNGGGGDPVGGGAPLDGGLSILLVLGASFGAKKMYHAFKNSK
jgi:hypothetical protein